MTEQVREWLTADRDLQHLGPGEVGLYRLTRPVVLGKEDLFGRTLLRSPLSDATLESTNLPLLVDPRPAGHQILEQHLGLQLGCGIELGSDIGLVLFKWIGACSPCVGLPQLRGELSLTSVLASRLTVHACFEGCLSKPSVFAQFLHQLPHLNVVDQLPEPSCFDEDLRSLAPMTTPFSMGNFNCRQRGKTMVAEHLDTIFVDEGFGSLDPEALDRAIDTLVNLQDGGRLVGIVSHVAELQARIDTRLEVVRGDQGSSAKFVLG